MQDKITSVRALEPADAGAFKALRLHAIDNSPTSIWPTRGEEEARTLEEVEQRIRSTMLQTVFGAFAGASLVGIAGIRREALTQVTHKATVWGVVVEPTHRGNGIARTLVTAAIAHASENWNIAQAHLCVNAENAPAKKLYAAIGFSTFGVEPRAMQVAGRFYDEEHMVLKLR
jgi:ribosomal protein S18 acetylase RimI-like enzyme